MTCVFLTTSPSKRWSRKHDQMKFPEDIQAPKILAGENGKFYSCINLPVILESLVDSRIFLLHTIHSQITTVSFFYSSTPYCGKTEKEVYLNEIEGT